MHETKNAKLGPKCRYFNTDIKINSEGIFFYLFTNFKFWFNVKV